MKFNGIVFLVFVVVIGFAVLKKQAAINEADQAKEASFPREFFVLDERPTTNPTVVIVSHPGCPQPDAERARALSAGLTQAGIPNQIIPRYEYYLTSQANIDAANRQRNHRIDPLVIVRGWGKYNPTTQEVVARYESPGR